MVILAEIDTVQVFIVVIAMVSGFIHWLWNAVKQANEERERQRQANEMDVQERALRDEAWRKQTQGQGPRPAAPPPIHDPWSTVRDVLEKIRQPQEPQRPASGSPPPLPPAPTASTPPVRFPAQPAPPPRVLRHSVRGELHPAPPPPPATPFPEAQATPSPRPVVGQAPSQPLESPPMLGPLSVLLRHPAGLRQAVLMQEILGPPKALQSSGGSSC